MKEVKLKNVDCVDCGRMFAIPGVILGFFIGLPIMGAAGPHAPLRAIVGGLIVVPLAVGAAGFINGFIQAIVMTIMLACTKDGLRLHVEIPEEDYVDSFSYPPEENVLTAMEKEKTDNSN